MAGTGYTVIRQTPDVYDFSAPGDPVLGVQVYFTTSGGNYGSVFVPASHYDQSHVRAAVAARAKLIDEVGSIHAGPADA